MEDPHDGAPSSSSGNADPVLGRRVSRARNRLAAFCRHFAKFDVEPLPDVPFHAHMVVRVMPNLIVVSGNGTVRKSMRTRELLAVGNDTLVFQIASNANRATHFGIRSHEGDISRHGEALQL